MRALPLLCLSLALVFPLAAAAQGRGLTISSHEEPTPPQPGIGGDAELPAGFQEVRWGATAEILGVVRGGMERQPVARPDLIKLIEQPEPGDDRRDIIHYSLWRDQLFELQIHYQDRLVGSEAHQLVRRVEKAYGKAVHATRSAAKSGHVNAAAEPVEETWQWEDPFTIQVLIRDIRTNEWSMLRRSKVLEYLQVRTRAIEAETDLDNKVNEIPID